MKVLFADISSTAERPAERLICLLNALNKARIEVELFCTSPSIFEGALSQEIIIHSPDTKDITASDEKAGKKKMSLWNWGGKEQSSFRKQIKKAFVRVLEISSFNLVHIVGFGDLESLLAKQAFRFELPYAIHVTEWQSDDRKDVSALVDATTIFTGLDSLKQQINKCFPEVYYRRFKSVPWPFIPPANSSAEKKNPGYDLCDNENSQPVVLVGPMDQTEGMEDVIEALGAVRKTIKDLHIIFAGNPAREHINKLPKENFRTMEWNAVFENKPEAALFIQTPRTGHTESKSEESYLNNLLLAMSFGLPVIVTDVEGMSDAVLGTGAGAIISPGSIKELTRAIEAYLNNPALLIKAGQASKKRIQNAYTPEAVAIKLIANYREMLTRK